MTFLTTFGYSGIESVLKLIGLIILCVLIILASYFTTRFVGKKQSGNSPESNFKSLDVFRLTPNKYLQLIQIGTRYFVLAVSKDSVEMITELSKEDITYWHTEKKVSFKEIMSKVTSSKKESKPDNE